MNRNYTTVELKPGDLADVPQVTEHFHEQPYDDLCYMKFKEMYIDPFTGQRFFESDPGRELKVRITTAGFGCDTMLDKMIDEIAHNNMAKTFLSYIYDFDSNKQSLKKWEILISPLWSETPYRVRPIDIQKGGWGR